MGPEYSGPAVVSILVFLELAPGQKILSPTDISAMVSILVFLELAPGRGI